MLQKKKKEMLVVVAKVFNKFEDGCARRRILYHIMYEYSSLLNVEQENHNCEMITKASIEAKNVCAAWWTCDKRNCWRSPSPIYDQRNCSVTSYSAKCQYSFNVMVSTPNSCELWSPLRCGEDSGSLCFCAKLSAELHTVLQES